MIDDWSGPCNYPWPPSIWIGYEPRETDAFIVARSSLLRHISIAPPPIRGVILSDLEKAGLYRRKWHSTAGRMVDHISDAPMSTQFAITRFLTPYLCGYKGWALFMDCDMLVRADIAELFALAETDKAVMCVKHVHEPPEQLKMDAQEQTRYARKNWSSVMLFNCGHPSNQKLSLDLVNRVPGRDLHRFCWLEDREIGELPAEWNYLVGHTVLDQDVEPKIVHFTNGTPAMLGSGIPYADEWHEELLKWVRGP